ncbi:MAG: asparagine synthase [Bacteroidales bacterium]|nr:asparagine synthase [Bacteroidales bacterium]
MAGIAGVLKKGEIKTVETMLSKIHYRGNFTSRIFELEDATIGMVWSNHEDQRVIAETSKNIFNDGNGHGQSAGIRKIDDIWQFHRDPLGVSPLFLAYEDNAPVYFGSEVKAILPVSTSIIEMPPAHILNKFGLKQDYVVQNSECPLSDPQEIAERLRNLLNDSIKRRIQTDTIGSWLSGGLDSSTIAALARPHVKTLHTFAGGLKGAPDLKHAQDVASYIGSHHHEAIITLDNMLKILPDVIYQLESFDALLVRSSIINLSVAWAASEYVSEVFTGEGGDELFAGYAYLKEIPVSLLNKELLNITQNLHNTALQRVDRTASSFGTKAHVIFADPEVFEFALSIPVELKIKDGIEKWILRRAMDNLLPERVVNRTKSKFWEGSGVGTLLWEHAYNTITDQDFLKERKLKNGWLLNTKEELFYYRYFKEQFGEPENLDWMGRTKGSPVFENIGQNSKKVVS